MEETFHAIRPSETVRSCKPWDLCACRDAYNENERMVSDAIVHHERRRRELHHKSTG